MASYPAFSALMCVLVASHAQAFTGFVPSGQSLVTDFRARAISLRSPCADMALSSLRMNSNDAGNDMGPRNTVDRKQFLAALSVIALGASVPWSPVQAEEAPVCNNILGCEQPKTLAPPKKVYKDIFEEERELAKQREEAAEKERKEKLQGEFKALHGQFGAILKGKNDMERDIKDLLGKIGAGPGDDQSWDDIRRIARLYDTALRKDGMEPTMGKVKKLKLEFDRKAGDEFAKKLNNALKNMDKAGKKRDVAITASSLDEALAATAGWLALEPKTD